jgi:hypothetical protein
MSASHRARSSSSKSLPDRDEDRPVYFAALLALVSAVFALLLEHSHTFC